MFTTTTTSAPLGSVFRQWFDPIKAALYTGPGLYAMVVGEGFDITITAKGRPVAMLAAARPPRRRWLAKSEFLARLHRAQANPGLRHDLALLAGDSTDDLGPIR